jgi:hypothetical protein
MKRFMKFLVLGLLLHPLGAFAAEEGGGDEGPKKPLPPPAIPAPDNINTYLHLKVIALKQAVAPFVEDRKLILSWQGEFRPRYVAAAFQHENFSQKHVFWRNENGVYFLVYDLTPDLPSTLQYRLIVDGLWQGDPANPDAFRNDQGILINQVKLGANALPPHDGPVQGYYGQLSFSYHGKPGQQVSVVGNFNQWDPFASYLEEVSPGEYRLSLVLPTGTVLYRFVVGTKNILDPGNGHTGHDAQGGVFSFFENKNVVPTTVLEASATPAAN